MTSEELAWIVAKTYLWCWLIAGMVFLLAEDEADPLERGKKAILYGGVWWWWLCYAAVMGLGMFGEIASEKLKEWWSIAAPKLQEFRRDASFEVICAWNRMKKAIERRREAWRTKRANG